LNNCPTDEINFISRLSQNQSLPVHSPQGFHTPGYQIESNEEITLAIAFVNHSGVFVAEAVDKKWPFAVVGKFLTEICFMF
jgi:hypothetical protein